MKKKKKIIGWREWISLPELNIVKIKAKIDSGARTSSLHAFDIQEKMRATQKMIHFKIQPDKDVPDWVVSCQVPLLEYRKVKSSNGHSELRPVIVSTINLMYETWPIELTLTDRTVMGFKMLLGRESLRKRFLIDTGKSFCAGQTLKDHISKAKTKEKKL